MKRLQEVLRTLTKVETRAYYEKVGIAQQLAGRKHALSEGQQIYIAERVKAGLPVTMSDIRTVGRDGQLTLPTA